MIEELRVIGNFERQMGIFHLAVKEHFRQLKADLLPKMPQYLARVIACKFPHTHCPKEKLLYGFSVEKSGRLRLLSGNGLQSQNGRLLTKLLEEALKYQVLSASEKRKLNERVSGIFGEYLDFEEFSDVRRGSITPARFLKKDVFILWDTLEIGDKVCGAYLLVVPFSTKYSCEPLSFALEHTRKNYRKILPFFAPVPGAETSELPRGIPNGRFSPEMNDLIQRYLATRETSFLPAYGRKFSFHDDSWFLRDTYLPDRNHEIWIFSERPRLPPIPAEILAKIGTIFLLTFWLWLFSDSLAHGRPRPVSMRFWVMSFFLFLGGGGLSALYFFGVNFLEASFDSQINDRINQAEGRLQAIDGSLKKVFQSHDQIFGQLISREDLANTVIDDESSSVKIFSLVQAALQDKASEVWLSEVLAY